MDRVGSTSLDERPHESGGVALLRRVGEEIELELLDLITVIAKEKRLLRGGISSVRFEFRCWS